MKEYILLAYGEDNSQNIGIVYILETAIRQNAFIALDVPVIRAKINRLLDYIEVKKRFDRLNIRANEKLLITSSGFSLDGHVFETLDEVEKALALKAFL